MCLYILGEWGKFTELLEKLDKVAALTEYVLRRFINVLTITSDQTIMYLVQTLGRLGNHVSEVTVILLVLTVHRVGCCRYPRTNNDPTRERPSSHDGVHGLRSLSDNTTTHAGGCSGTLEAGLEQLQPLYPRCGVQHSVILIRTAYCLSALSKMKSVTAKEIALTHLMASRWCPITNAENTF